TLRYPPTPCGIPLLLLERWVSVCYGECVLLYRNRFLRRGAVVAGWYRFFCDRRGLGLGFKFGNCLGRRCFIYLAMPFINEGAAFSIGLGLHHLRQQFERGQVKHLAQRK